MSVFGVSGVKAGEREESVPSGWFGQARWLARQDIRRAWLSYPVSGLFMLFFGVLVAPSVSGILEIENLGAQGRSVEGLFNAFFPDYLFLIMSLILAVNALSLDYLKIWQDDVFSHRLVFLKSLPLSAGTLVASRAMSMLFALPLNALAFFLPVFFISDLGELGFSYVWFCGVWLGGSIFYAGVTLLCELGLSGRVYVWLSVGIIVAVIALLLLLEWTVSLGLVARTAALAQGYGPLPALASLLVGVVGFVLLARLTARRIERRELST